MRDYGKVSPQFWTGASGRRLRGNPDAQLLALYLMTCPASSMTGIFYLPVTTVSHETGLSLGRVNSALRLLMAEQVVAYDHEQALMYVPQMARFQIGEHLEERDKRRNGIIRELAAFKDHHFVSWFWNRYEGPYKLPKYNGKPLRSPFEAPSGSEYADQKPLRSQEQEQDQEQEQEQERGSSDPRESDQVLEVIAHYRTYHPRAFRCPNPEQREWQKIQKLLRAGYSADELKTVIDAYQSDPWHQGENDAGKKYDSLELYLRDEEHVRRGLEMRGAAQAPTMDPLREIQERIAARPGMG